jgi:hypothetical protein
VFNHSKSPHKPLRFHRFTYGHCHFCKQLQLSPSPFVLLNITLSDMMISSSQSNEKSCREVGLSALAKLDAEHVELKALLDNNHKERSKITSIEHLPNKTLANIFKFAAVLRYARVGELPSPFVVSQVNSRWHMVATHNPNIRTDLRVFLKTPVHIIKQCLSRSKDYLLDVVVYLAPPPSAIISEANLSFLFSAINVGSYRWRSLLVFAFSTHILHLAAARLVDVAAPNLTRFQLSEFCTPQGPPLISQVYPLFTPLTCPTTLILYQHMHMSVTCCRFSPLLTPSSLNLGIRQIPVSPYAPIHQAMIRLPWL